MSGRKIGNLILMTLICVVVFIVFMAIRPAPAELVSPAPTRLLVDVVKLERYCASMLMPPAVAAQSPDAQAIFITGCVGGALLRAAADPSSITFFNNLK